MACNTHQPAAQASNTETPVLQRETRPWAEPSCSHTAHHQPISATPATTSTAECHSQPVRVRGMPSPPNAMRKLVTGWPGPHPRRLTLAGNHAGRRSNLATCVRRPAAAKPRPNRNAGGLFHDSRYGSRATINRCQHVATAVTPSMSAGSAQARKSARTSHCHDALVLITTASGTYTPNAA